MKEKSNQFLSRAARVRLLGGIAFGVMCLEPASFVYAAELKVSRGDTLMSLARSITPEGVTVQQATVAMYLANPNAFDGSIHRMRNHATLNVPSPDAMAAISKREAQAVLKGKKVMSQLEPVRPMAEATLVVEKIVAEEIPMAKAFMAETPAEQALAEATSATAASLRRTDTSAASAASAASATSDLSVAALTAVMADPTVSQQADRMSSASMSGESMSRESKNFMPEELSEIHTVVSELKMVLGKLDTSVSQNQVLLGNIERRLDSVEASYGNGVLTVGEAEPVSTMVGIAESVARDSAKMREAAAMKMAAMELATIDDARKFNTRMALAALADSAKQSSSGMADDRAAEDVQLAAATPVRNWKKAALLGGGLFVLAGSAATLLLLYRRRLSKHRLRQEQQRYTQFSQRATPNSYNRVRCSSVQDSYRNESFMQFDDDTIARDDTLVRDDTFVQNDTFALDDTIKDETLRSKSRGSSQPMVNSVVDVDLHVDLHEQDLHAAAESPPEFNETLFDESSSFEETVSLTQRLNENDSFEAALVDDEDVYRNMELKLVLAKAYIENGFVEEARALLQDISGRGHEEQQRRAMRLLREVNGGVTKRAS